MDIEEIAKQSDAIEAAAQRAVRRALREHKQSGDPVVFCENGTVQWIPAEEIVVPDEPPAP